LKPIVGFKPPSFSNKGPDQGAGFMPISSQEKMPSISQPVLNSSSMMGGAGSKGYYELFNGTGLQSDDLKDKNGNLKYMQVFIPPNSNQNSIEMPSFNFNPDSIKNPKIIKVSPNASFQSQLPNFSKDTSRNMFLTNNKSGSMEGKYGFIGAPGSFNLKFNGDNQK